MTSESQQVPWTVDGLLGLFDVASDGDLFVGPTGLANEDDRQVVEGTQILAQAIVAVAKRFPDKSIRSAHAVFARAVVVGAPVMLTVDVIHEGRSTAAAVVSAAQNVPKRGSFARCGEPMRPSTFVPACERPGGLAEVSSTSG